MEVPNSKDGMASSVDCYIQGSFRRIMALRTCNVASIEAKAIEFDVAFVDHCFQSSCQEQLCICYITSTHMTERIPISLK